MRRHLAWVLAGALLLGSVGLAGPAPVASAGSHVDAIGYVDPADGDRVKVELAFGNAIDDTTVAPGDVTVRLANGSTVPVLGIEHPAGADDRQVVLDLGGGVRAAALATVAIADGAIRTAGGDAVAGATVTVTTTTGTIDETLGGAGTADGDDIVAYRGERIAVRGDTLDEGVLIETDGGAFVFEGSTGPGSQIYVFETAGRALETYRAVFDGADRFDPARDGTVRLRRLDLNVSLTATAARPDQPLAGRVTANAGNRAVRLQLEYPNGTLINRTLRLDGTGTATFDLGSPTATGTYTVRATDRATGIAATPVTQRRATPTFELLNFTGPETATIGERVRVTATVRNRGPVSGTVIVEYRIGGFQVATGGARIDANATARIQLRFPLPSVPTGRTSQRVTLAGAAGELSKPLTVRADRTPTATPTATASPTPTATATPTTTTTAATVVTDTTTAPPTSRRTTAPPTGTTATTADTTATATTPGQPGLGVLAAVAGFGALLLLGRQRRHR